MKTKTRDHLIVRCPLADAGTSLTPQKYQERMNKLNRNLFADIRALASLRASKLEQRYEPLATGLCVGFYLVEIRQMALQFPTVRSDRSILIDPFLQEVALVKSQQKGILHKIDRAMSPALDPSLDQDVIKIRKRLKNSKRAEGFLIPCGPEPERLHPGNLPKVLPRGYELNVRVRINWLDPKKAEVKVYEATNLQGDNTFSLLTNARINLLRQGIHRRPASGRQLQEAMDTSRDLRLLVTVALNWTSGEALYLELVAFVK